MRIINARVIPDFWPGQLADSAAAWSCCRAFCCSRPCLKLAAFGAGQLMDMRIVFKYGIYSLPTPMRPTEQYPSF